MLSPRRPLLQQHPLHPLAEARVNQAHRQSSLVVEELRTVQINVSAPAYPIFRVVKNTLLPQIDVEACSPQAMRRG